MASRRVAGFENPDRLSGVDDDHTAEHDADPAVGVLDRRRPGVVPNGFLLYVQSSKSGCALDAAAALCSNSSTIAANPWATSR